MCMCAVCHRCRLSSGFTTRPHAWALVSQPEMRFSPSRLINEIDLISLSYAFNADQIRDFAPVAARDWLQLALSAGSGTVHHLRHAHVIEALRLLKTMLINYCLLLLFICYSSWCWKVIQYIFSKISSASFGSSVRTMARIGQRQSRAYVLCRKSNPRMPFR